MLILTHAFAFVAGVLSAIALIHLAARRLAAHPRPLSRRRLAIRRANADRLPARADLSDRLVAELNAIVQEQ